MLFLEELNRKAASLFDDNLVTVEELYFRLAAKFQHYLMDEFQDTSLSQWRNPCDDGRGGAWLRAGPYSMWVIKSRRSTLSAAGRRNLFDAVQIQLSVLLMFRRASLDKNHLPQLPGDH